MKPIYTFYIGHWQSFFIKAKFFQLRPKKKMAAIFFKYFFLQNRVSNTRFHKGGRQGVFLANFFFGVSYYIGHYEPFANFWRNFFGLGAIRKFWGPTPNPHPKFSNFLFHYLAQRVIHGWKALVLRIPEHFLFFLCDVFWPSYEQKRNSKNVENPPKSAFLWLKSNKK